MLREVLMGLAGLAGLAASACTIGLPTVVDAAPFEARMTEAPVPDGTWCGLTITREGELLVRGMSVSGCVQVSWIEAERMIRMTPLEDGGAPTSVAPVELGDGVFMLQFTLGEQERADKPFAFTLMAGMTEGDTFVVFPLPSDGKFNGEPIIHSGVTFAVNGGGTPPPPMPAGTEDAPVDEMALRRAEIEAQYVYIASGEPKAIRDLALSLVQRGVRYIKAEAAERGAPLWMGLPMFVRDDAELLDHPPSAEQMRRIEALAAKVSALVE